MCGVTLLEVLDDAQCVYVVVEAASMTDEAAIQSALAGMSERRMADVVNQRQRLREIFVQAKRGRSGAGNLSDLDGVGKTAAKVIGGATGKHLGLPCQSPKGTGLHDPLPVTLEGRARRAKRRRIDAGQKEIVRTSGDRASMEIEGHSQI
jgi:hypothetical protein